VSVMGAARVGQVAAVWGGGRSVTTQPAPRRLRPQGLLAGHRLQCAVVTELLHTLVL
jgi:hypothetical protein